jgi:hypothetical protein
MATSCYVSATVKPVFAEVFPLIEISATRFPGWFSPGGFDEDRPKAFSFRFAFS